ISVKECGHSTITFSWIWRTASLKLWVSNIEMQQCCSITSVPILTVLIHFIIAGSPVSSSSGAASFSFKVNPSIPSGNTAAVGSSAAASNPPTFGVTSSPSVPNPVGFGNSSAPSAASFSFKTSGTTGGCGTSGLSGFGSSAAANSSSTAPLPVSAAPSAATGTSQSGASSASAAQTAGASGHNVTSAPSAVPSGIASDKLYTPRSELTAEELEQFEAKRFTLGKIPLKPPPIDLLYL
ncbi:hypothetical protein CIB84_015860, partial [Bambusicola thoracicus]